MLYQDPSPKLQFQEVGIPPIELSLNWTVSGVNPDVWFAVKLATGATIGSVTVITVPGSVDFSPTTVRHIQLHCP